MTVGDNPHLALMVCLMGAVLTPFRVGVCKIRLCMVCITKGTKLKTYFESLVNCTKIIICDEVYKHRFGFHLMNLSQ